MNSNEIDKLFKSKLEQHQVPFDESSWLKAQALLDEKMPVKSGSKNRTLMYWAVAASIITFVAYFGLENSDSDSNSQPMAENTSTVIDENQKNTSGSAEETTLNSTVNEQAHTASSITHQSTSETGENERNSNTGNSNSVANGLPHNNSSNNNALMASAGSPFTSGGHPIDETSATLPTSAQATASSNQSNAATTVNELPTKYAFLNSFDLGTETVASPSSEKIQEVIQPVRDISYYSWGISIFGGLNMMPSLNPQNSKMGLGGNVGLVADKSISDHLAFKAGLNYEMLNGIHLEKSSVANNYSYGLTEKTTTTTTNQVHQLNLPISVQYKVAEHSFELGANLSYGLFTNTVTTSTTEGNFESSTASDNTVGFNPDINRFNYALLAGYQYTIDDKAAIGLQTQYNLSSMVNEPQFKNPFITRIFLALKIK